MRRHSVIPGVYSLVIWFFTALIAAVCAFPAVALAQGANEADAPAQNPATENPTDPFAEVSRALLEVEAIGWDNLFDRRFNWTAVENLDFESANEDGSLSVWQPGWLISHDWSDYGRAIADLQPGDAVTVNGSTVLILGRDLWPNTVYNWDVYDIIGWNKVVFQTCSGDDDIWIAYGVVVNPTPQFLAEHGE